jgi:hypothetical protein
LVAADEPGDRSAAKLAVGLLLFFSLLALFASLTLYQLTSEGTAKRTLRRSVATLTEIDPLLDRNYDDLQRRAGAAAPGDTLYLTNYPIRVPLSPEQAKTISKGDLRALLLDRSAGDMYQHGTSALRDPASKAGSVGIFSVAGISNHGLGFLRARNHDILRVLTLVLAVVSLVLAVALASICRGFGRIGSVGLVTLIAAAPLTLAGVGVWAYCRVNDGAGTEYTKRQFAQIGGGLAWVPMRDGFAFVVLGMAMVAIAVACAAWSARRSVPRYDVPPYVP